MCEADTQWALNWLWPSSSLSNGCQHSVLRESLRGKPQHIHLNLHVGVILSLEICKSMHQCLIYLVFIIIHPHLSFSYTLVSLKCLILAVFVSLFYFRLINLAAHCCFPMILDVFLIYISIQQKWRESLRATLAVSWWTLIAPPTKLPAELMALPTLFVARQNNK